MLCSALRVSGSRYLEVVQTLIDPPIEARLLWIRAQAATLAMSDGSLCAVFDAEAIGDDELAAAMTRFVRGNDHLGVKVVLVGAAPRHRTLLSSLQPRVMMGRIVQVFALEQDGQTWVGARSRLDSPTGRTLVEVARRPPIAIDLATVAERQRPPDAEQVAHAREVLSFVHKTRAGHPWAVWSLLAGIAGVFALEWLWGGTELTPTLVRMGANLPARWTAEPWRLLSSAWLHAGPVHVLVNGVALLLLGGFIERLLGWPRLVLLYVVAALGGSLASAIGAHAQLSVGASGAIWGILGASAALAWRPAGLVPDAVLPQLRRNAFMNIAINLLLSMKPEIDLLAHVGGGIVGGALVWSGLLTRGVGDGRQSGGRRLAAAAAAAVALLLASLPIAWSRERPWALDDLEPRQLIALSERDGTIEVPPTLAGLRAQDGTTLRSYELGDLRVDAFELHLVIGDAPVRAPHADVDPRTIASEALGVPEQHLQLLDGPDAPRWPTFVTHDHEGQLDVLAACQVRDDGFVRLEAAHWSALPGFGPALERALRSYDRP